MATITSPREPSPNPNRITSPTLQSRAGTPAPSVRTSFDALSATGSTSNVSTPTTVTATPVNQRRNRAALRDYYNLKAKSQTAGSGAISPGTAGGRRLSTDSASTVASSNATLTTTTGGNGDGSGFILPPQIDDPTFNAETYVQGLLKTSTLRDILRAEGTLVSEIRNLDGERKALVYDNYSKLIKAVGTIGEMQRGMTRDKSSGSGSNGRTLQYQSGGDYYHSSRNANSSISGDAGLDGIKSLEAKLDKLMTVVREIKDEQGRSSQIRGSEQTGSVMPATMTTRRSVRDQRKGQELVKWVVDAPARLQKLVDEDEKDEAEKQWIYVQTLLAKWKGTKGVDEVRLGCLKVMGTEESGHLHSDDDGDEDNDDDDTATAAAAAAANNTDDSDENIKDDDNGKSNNDRRKPNKGNR